MGRNLFLCLFHLRGWFPSFLGWEPLTTKIPLPRLLFSLALYLGLVRTLCLNRAHVDNPRSSPHHEILNLITCAWSFLSCNITYSIFWELAHGHLGRDGGREHHSGSHRLPQGLNAVVQVRHKYRARSFNNIGFFPGFFPSDSLLHCCSPLLRGWLPTQSTHPPSSSASLFSSSNKKFKKN